MPQRIQRKRVKGFNLQAASSNPNGVVYVGRPTKYGNPYYFVEEHKEGLSLLLYENTAHGIWEPSLLDGLPDELAERVYEAHQGWMRRFGKHPLEVIQDELGKKDLACFCPLADKDGNSVPCHADILLRLANA